MNNCQWRAIVGYEGVYEVSNLGEVKSLPRKISNGNGFYISSEKLLKRSKSTTGYLKVELSDNAKKKSLKVHRLVAMCFIPNPLNKPNVNHIDGNILNNEVKNLNWCTQAENVRHSNALGLRKKKLNITEEIELIKLYLSKVSAVEISTKFNISKGLIHVILKRHNIGRYKNSERKIKFVLCKDKILEELKHKKQSQLAVEIGCDPSLISHYVKRIKINGGICKCSTV
jgi:hypothetical protein